MKKLNFRRGVDSMIHRLVTHSATIELKFALGRSKEIECFTTFLNKTEWLRNRGMQSHENNSL